jgi:hypothetical protein
MVEDIVALFPTPEDAATALTFFDGDGNVSREELEATCLYVKPLHVFLLTYNVIEKFIRSRSQ